MQVVQVWSLGRELRSHMQQKENENAKGEGNCYVLGAYVKQILHIILFTLCNSPMVWA